MRRTLAGLFWLIVYLGIVLGSLGIVAGDPAPAVRPFWVDMAVALGFVAFVQMGLQFILVARFPRVTNPYGIDLIMDYHRKIAMAGAVILLLHPAILIIRSPQMIGILNPLGGTAATRWGVISVIALIILFATSLLRRKLNIPYEWWRVVHIVTSVVAIVAALMHIILLAAYANSPAKRGILVVFTIAMILVLAYLRIGRPLLLRNKPWRVVEVTRERGRSWTLRAEPVGHAGISFAPGQFVWMKTGKPLTLEEHPFSFSSSAEQTSLVEFGIKELGDFTGRIGELPPGTPLYFDGPHGSFSIDLFPAAGYIFIAGGIGVTPFLSMIRTMADRDDRRPVLLVFGSRCLENAPFREDLEALTRRARLDITFVLEQPDEGWNGERGFITKDVLARVLPKEKFKRDVFVCGPLPMMVALESDLRELGFPPGRIHTEKFDLV